MQRLKKFLALTFVTSMAFGFTLMASPQSADAGWWTWNRYQLKFWLPRGVKPTKNTRWDFIAKGKGLVVKIHSWKARRGTSVAAAKYGFNTYRIIKRKRIIRRKRLKGKGGAWRYLYVGTGYVRGTRVYFAVIGMANYRLKTRHYVRFWWKKWRHKWVLPRVSRIARSIHNIGGRRLVRTPRFNRPSSGNWTWKRYRLKFWLPQGVRPTKNTRWDFIAKGKGLVVKIHSWKARRGTSVAAAKYGFNTYRIIKRKRILRRKRLKGKGGTWRYLYVGSGYVRGTRVYFAVIGMANYRLKTRHYVRFWWKKWRHKWVLPRVSRIARSIYSY